MPCGPRSKPKRVSLISFFGKIHFIQVFGSSKSILHARSIRRAWG